MALFLHHVGVSVLPFPRNLHITSLMCSNLSETVSVGVYVSLYIHTPLVHNELKFHQPPAKIKELNR